MKTSHTEDKCQTTNLVVSETRNPSISAQGGLRCSHCNAEETPFPTKPGVPRGRAGVGRPDRNAGSALTGPAGSDSELMLPQSLTDSSL